MTHVERPVEISRSSTPTASSVDASPTVVIRNGTADDCPLLFDAFFRVYGGSESWYGRGTPHRILRAKMEQLLEAPHWRFTVACPSHEQTEIMGMLVHCPPTERNRRYQVGWISVKHDWLGNGIARALLKHAGMVPPMELDCAFIMRNMLPKAGEPTARHGFKLYFKPYLPDIALLNTIIHRNKQNGEEG